jgi:hypothetical protein
MGEVAVHRLPGSVLVVGVQDSILKVFKLDSLYGSNPFYRMSGLSRTFGKRFTTYPCFAQLDSLSILVGAESGTLYQFNVSGDTLSTRTVGNESVTSIALLPTLLSSKPEEYFFTSGNYIYGEQRPAADLRPSLNSWMLAAAVSPKGNYIVAAEKKGSMVISYDQSLSNKLFEVNVQGSAINELAIADLDGDGEKDVIVQATKYISVLNRVGALLDGFPIQARGNYEFTGTPLIVDFNGDNKLEIVLLTNDGELWVYDRIGKLLSGFPVQVTSSEKSYLVAYRNPSDTLGIAILSENGSFDAFLTSSKVTATSLVWWQHLGDERHRNAEWTKTTSSPLSPEFLPKSRVYNWPNPVYTRSTQIRYYTSEDADVTVMILDLSGVKITELKGKGVRGMDNEITWDVSNIQSGVYLARVEARSSARSEVAFIKIAVVK